MKMKTQTYNLLRGNRFLTVLEFEQYNGTGDPDLDESYDPIDLNLLTGIKLTIRNAANRKGAIFADLSLGAGLTIDPVVPNSLQIKIADTDNWTTGTYAGDLRFTFPGDEFESYSYLFINVTENTTINENN